jgi:hypothetical protein
MANPFDRFDEEIKAAPVARGREVSSGSSNPFDVFDKPRLGRAATESQVLMPGESAKPQPQEEVKAPTEEEAKTLDYLVNSFKRGLITSTALFDALTRAGFGQMAKAELAKTGALTPEETMKEVYGIGKESKPMLESVLEAVKESQERVSPVFEAVGVKPPDLDMVAPGPISQIAGAAVETLADPLSYIGLGAPTKALLATKTAGRAAGEATTGAAAETGAMLGEEAEKAITGEEGIVGRTVGALTGAVGSAVPRGIATRTGEDVVSQIMQNRALLKESPEGAEQAYAKGTAKRLLTAATEAEGAGELQDLIGQINDASRFVNKGDAPLVIAMADNPVIRQQIQRLAITRPEFRKKVNDLIKAAEGDVQRKTGFLFGERYAADIPEGAQINIQNIARRRQNLDKELNEKFAFVRPFEDTEDFGRRVEALVEQKKRLARAEVAPEYDALLEEARRQGIRMPEEGTQLIYDFVRDNNIRDIFGRGTAVDRRIMSFLKPKEVEEAVTPRILGPEGAPISELAAEQIQYPTLSFDNVESLKKEINLIKRKSLSDSERRKINDLEKIVDEARDTIPGNFSDRLREVDLKYYQKVGVPFSEQGIREIDAKRYAEQIAPVIVKNAEAYRQFVRAVGPEQGNTLAERAILNELYEKAAKGGAGLLSPTVVAKYVRDKGEIIDNIPGLKEKLQKAVVDDTQLRAEISSLDKAAKEAQKRVADNYLTQTEFPDYESLTRNFMRNPKIRAKLLRDIGDLDANTAKAVRNSLRAEVINSGRSQGNLLDYVSAPENKAAIEQLFGPGYLPALRKIALFGDKVASADVSRLGTQIPRESMDVVAQVFPGLDVPYLSSNFRDRITSLPQKIIRILSKYNSARLQIATDDAIEELLLDPNGVKKLGNTISEVNFKFDNPVALNKIAESLSQTVPQATYDAFKVTLSGEERERLQKEAREKTGSEIVFGGFEGEEPSFEQPKPQVSRPQPPAEAPTPRGTTISTPTSFTWDEVTPEMKEKAANVYRSLGMYETGGLNETSFNRLPIEKRKRFFNALGMARGGPVRYSPQEEALLRKYAR